MSGITKEEQAKRAGLRTPLGKALSSYMTASHILVNTFCNPRHYVRNPGEALKQFTKLEKKLMAEWHKTAKKIMDKS